MFRNCRARKGAFAMEGVGNGCLWAGVFGGGDITQVSHLNLLLG